MYKNFDSKKHRDKILQYRKKAGFTQKQVEKILNLRTASILEYEKGKLRIPSEILLKLANLYSCTLEDLLGITATNKKNEFVNTAGRLEETYIIKKFIRDCCTKRQLPEGCLSCPYFRPQKTGNGKKATLNTECGIGFPLSWDIGEKYRNKIKEKLYHQNEEIS